MVSKLRKCAFVTCFCCMQELRAGLEAGWEAGSEGGPALEPLGLALLHPNLAGEAGPSFTRILGKSRQALLLITLFSLSTWHGLLQGSL